MRDPARPSFELLTRLGSGGMGDVFRARMTTGGEAHDVALKRVRAVTPELTAAFEREARLCALLDHPRIVHLHAWGYDEAGPYLALEFVDGRPASQLVQQWVARGGRLPLAAGLEIAVAVAEALHYAHTFTDAQSGVEAVIHRDVSLDNVLVGWDGAVKLADFGVAKIVGITSHTRTGVVKGKHGHLAPELFEGAEADVLTDIFAYGATVYRLVSGLPAFRGKSDAELMRAVLQGATLPLRTVCPTVPETLARTIDRCLQIDRAQRPRSMAEILAVLGELGVGAGASPDAVRAAMDEAFPVDERDRTSLSFALAPDKTVSARPQVREGPSSTSRRILGAMALVATLAALGAWRWRSAILDHDPRPLPQATSRSAELGTARPESSPAPTAPTPALVVPVPAPTAPTATTRLDGTAAPTASPGLNNPPPKPAEEEPRPSTSAARATPRPKTAHKKEGRLRIKVSPWAKVFIDGELVGETPLAPVALSEGTHNLILVNESLGVRSAYQVTVRGGRDNTFRAVLRAAQAK